MDESAVASLSDMQIACLRLVGDLLKTEQIADRLGISPSTVNTHIERAIARLGTPNRREAARLVRAYEKTQAGAEATEPEDWPTGAVAPPIPAAITAIPRPEKSLTEALPLAAAGSPPADHAPSTIAMGRRRNDLTVPQRLMLAVLALMLLCIAIAGLGAAIEQLSHWRSSLAQRR